MTDSATATKASIDGRIKLHDAAAFDGMRKAGRLAAATLDHIAPFVKPGISTAAIDKLCHDFMIQGGGVPATLGYRGYTKSCCTSVNHVVCHGIPDEKKILQDGDTLNIDVTVILDGWHGDTSRMFFVGNVGVKPARLAAVTYEAMMAGIAVIKPGATTGDIGHAIQTIAEKNRYSIVRDFCGHGLGRVFHDAPNILHYGEPGTGILLKEGMFFTVEPMVNAGKWQVKLLDDGWTAVTRDRSLSAQFEHSVGVTATGYEIFTTSPDGLHQPPY